MILLQEAVANDDGDVDDDEDDDVNGNDEADNFSQNTENNSLKARMSFIMMESFEPMRESR